MNRITVLNSIIKKKNAENYLEIGVSTGTCLFNIKAKKKIAVDPYFKFPYKKEIEKLDDPFYYLTKPKRVQFYNVDDWNVFNEYYQMTSDLFFEKNQELLKEFPIDVAFIDGMHTFEQSYKDVINTLKYLKDDGVIVMHDCSPRTKLAAYPAQSYNGMKKMKFNDWSGEWNGDVWKSVVKLRAKFHGLDIFVLDCDHGLGIIKKGKPEVKLVCSDEDIDKLNYAILESKRKEILNLKPVEYFEEFLKTI